MGHSCRERLQPACHGVSQQCTWTRYSTDQKGLSMVSSPPNRPFSAISLPQLPCPSPTHSDGPPKQWAPFLLQYLCSAAASRRMGRNNRDGFGHPGSQRPDILMVEAIVLHCPDMCRSSQALCAAHHMPHGGHPRHAAMPWASSQGAEASLAGEGPAEGMATMEALGQAQPWGLQGVWCVSFVPSTSWPQQCKPTGKAPPLPCHPRSPGLPLTHLPPAPISTIASWAM